MMQAENLRLTFNAGTPIENPALRGISLRISVQTVQENPLF